MADRVVSCGRDIADANDFFRELKDITNVKLYFIPEEKINEISKTIPSNINILKGTLSVHQIVTTGDGLFKYRDVSCFCEKISTLCPCFEVLEYNCQMETELASHENNQSILKVSEVYSSDSSDFNDISTDEESVDNPVQEVLSSNIKAGKYMLAEFKTNRSTHNIKYKYVVVAQEDMDEDEVQVMCLKTIKDCGKFFRADEDDVSYIHLEQIVKILPEPKCKLQGDRLYYEFPSNVDVYEKA